MKIIVHYYDNCSIVKDPAFVNIFVFNPKKINPNVKVILPYNIMCTTRFPTIEEALIYAKQLQDRIVNEEEIIHLYSK